MNIRLFRSARSKTGFQRKCSALWKSEKSFHLRFGLLLNTNGIRHPKRFNKSRWSRGVRSSSRYHFYYWSIIGFFLESSQLEVQFLVRFQPWLEWLLFQLQMIYVFELLKNDFVGAQQPLDRQQQLQQRPLLWFKVSSIKNTLLYPKMYPFF